MRKYDYEKKWQALLEPEIISLLTTIHEYRGREILYKEAKPDALNGLMEIAKIQSTDASNRIEGIYTTEERLRKIVMDKTAPKTRSEKEIAGYRDVLNTIHESYGYMPVTPSIILQMHRDLYKFSGSEKGGLYKVNDNEIAEIDPDGNKTVRFIPVSAWETSESIEELCRAYKTTIDKPDVDPLLIIPMFTLDFLCVHPFSDGNGRMSRLLTLLLLYKSDYNVGRYISIEKLINETKTNYYEALQESSYNWHEESNSYLPFVKYMLGIVVAAYREFSARIDLLSQRGLSKPEMVRDVVKETLGTITVAEIKERCPNISYTTIQRSLRELQKKGEVIKISGGRYTSYTWNRKNDL